MPLITAEYVMSFVPLLIVDLDSTQTAEPHLEPFVQVRDTDDARSWLADHEAELVCVWAGDCLGDALGFGWDMRALAPHTATLVFARTIPTDSVSEWDLLGISPRRCLDSEQFYAGLPAAISELRANKSDHEPTDRTHRQRSLDRHSFKSRLAALVATVYAFEVELEELEHGQGDMRNLRELYIPRLIDIAGRLEAFADQLPARGEPHG